MFVNIKLKNHDILTKDLNGNIIKYIKEEQNNNNILPKSNLNIVLEVQKFNFFFIFVLWIFIAIIGILNHRLSLVCFFTFSYCLASCIFPLLDHFTIPKRTKSWLLVLYSISKEKEKKSTHQSDETNLLSNLPTTENLEIMYDE